MPSITQNIKVPQKLMLFLFFTTAIICQYNLRNKKEFNPPYIQSNNQYQIDLKEYFHGGLNITYTTKSSLETQVLQPVNMFFKLAYPQFMNAHFVRFLSSHILIGVWRNYLALFEFSPDYKSFQYIGGSYYKFRFETWCSQLEPLQNGKRFILWCYVIQHPNVGYYAVFDSLGQKLFESLAQYRFVINQYKLRTFALNEWEQNVLIFFNPSDLKTVRVMTLFKKGVTLEEKEILKAKGLNKFYYHEYPISESIFSENHNPFENSPLLATIHFYGYALWFLYVDRNGYYCTISAGFSRSKQGQLVFLKISKSKLKYMGFHFIPNLSSTEFMMIAQEKKLNFAKIVKIDMEVKWKYEILRCDFSESDFRISERHSVISKNRILIVYTNLKNLIAGYEILQDWEKITTSYCKTNEEKNLSLFLTLKNNILFEYQIDQVLRVHEITFGYIVFKGKHEFSNKSIDFEIQAENMPATLKLQERLTGVLKGKINIYENPFTNYEIDLHIDQIEVLKGSWTQLRLPHEALHGNAEILTLEGKRLKTRIFKNEIKKAYFGKEKIPGGKLELCQYLGKNILVLSELGKIFVYKKDFNDKYEIVLKLVNLFENLDPNLEIVQAEVLSSAYIFFIARLRNKIKQNTPKKSRRRILKDIIKIKTKKKFTKEKLKKNQKRSNKPYQNKKTKNNKKSFFNQTKKIEENPEFDIFQKDYKTGRTLSKADTYIRSKAFILSLATNSTKFHSELGIEFESTKKNPVIQTSHPVTNIIYTVERENFTHLLSKYFTQQTEIGYQITKYPVVMIIQNWRYKIRRILKIKNLSKSSKHLALVVEHSKYEPSTKENPTLIKSILIVEILRKIGSGEKTYFLLWMIGTADLSPNVTDFCALKKYIIYFENNVKVPDKKDPKKINQKSLIYLEDIMSDEPISYRKRYYYPFSGLGLTKIEKVYCLEKINSFQVLGSVEKNGQKEIYLISYKVGVKLNPRESIHFIERLSRKEWDEMEDAAPVSTSTSSIVENFLKPKELLRDNLKFLSSSTNTASIEFYTPYTSLDYDIELKMSVDKLVPNWQSVKVNSKKLRVKVSSALDRAILDVDTSKRIDLPFEIEKWNKENKKFEQENQNLNSISKSKKNPTDNSVTTTDTKDKEEESKKKNFAPLNLDLEEKGVVSINQNFYRAELEYFNGKPVNPEKIRSNSRMKYIKDLLLPYPVSVQIYLDWLLVIKQEGYIQLIKNYFSKDESLVYQRPIYFRAISVEIGEIEDNLVLFIQSLNQFTNLFSLKIYIMSKSGKKLLEMDETYAFKSELKLQFSIRTRNDGNYYLMFLHEDNTALTVLRVSLKTSNSRDYFIDYYNYKIEAQGIISDYSGVVIDKNDFVGIILLENTKKFLAFGINDKSTQSVITRNLGFFDKEGIPEAEKIGCINPKKENLSKIIEFDCFVANYGIENYLVRFKVSSTFAPIVQETRIIRKYAAIRSMKTRIVRPKDRWIRVICENLTEPPLKRNNILMIFSEENEFLQTSVQLEFKPSMSETRQILSSDVSDSGYLAIIKTKKRAVLKNQLVPGNEMGNKYFI